MVYSLASQRISGAKQEMSYPAARGSSGFAQAHKKREVEIQYWPAHKPIPDGWRRHKGLDKTHHGPFSTFIEREVK